MIETQETRSLVREIEHDLAPVVAYIASTDKQLRDWGLRKDLGAPFQKLVKADLISHQQLKSSVAAAHRWLSKIEAELLAIETGYRRPVAGRRPAAAPFEDQDDDDAASKQRRVLH